MTIVMCARMGNRTPFQHSVDVIIRVNSTETIPIIPADYPRQGVRGQV